MVRLGLGAGGQVLAPTMSRPVTIVLVVVIALVLVFLLATVGVQQNGS
jgi:hypothetical protein